MFIIVVLLGLAASIFMVAKPEWIWTLDHFLTVKDGEPSEWYITITRIGGMLLFFLCILALMTLV